MKLGENHNPSTFLGVPTGNFHENQAIWNCSSKKFVLGYLLEIFMKIKQFGIVLQKFCSWVPTGNFHENQAI
jgi:hypothetical protein